MPEKTKNQRIVFLYAFLLAVFIFILGLFIGFTFENVRNSFSYQTYMQSEIRLTDIKLQSDIINNFDIRNCDLTTQQNIEFGNEIYNEARMLENYESSNKISDVIKSEHKNFDLLRALFWVNSIKIKQKCNASYVNVVYIYNYNNPSLDEKALQTIYSQVLMQTKNKYGTNMILIPIAGDNNLSSIDTLLINYDVKELPVILINEKIQLKGIVTAEELEKAINQELKIDSVTRL